MFVSYSQTRTLYANVDDKVVEDDPADCTVREDVAVFRSLVAAHGLL